MENEEMTMVEFLFATVTAWSFAALILFVLVKLFG